VFGEYAHSAHWRFEINGLGPAEPHFKRTGLAGMRTGRPIGGAAARIRTHHSTDRSPQIGWSDPETPAPPRLSTHSTGIRNIPYYTDKTNVVVDVYMEPEFGKDAFYTF
jgi:hypothetical protein